MFYSPIKYDEPVFRPPAEAYSAILQLTLGCSWNRCAFCEMYTSKKFRIRTPDEIKEDIRLVGRNNVGVRKVFLADGNAFVLSANRLLPVLQEIKQHFPRLQRVSSYALPDDILKKSDQELIDIREAGLKLLYIGIESGDDELLKLMNKGESAGSTIEGIQKAHDAGIDTSVMIITGLGGKKFSKQHALRSAKVVNTINPKLLSTLTLSMPFGLEHFQSRFKGEYIPMSIRELGEELKLFLEEMELENCIFRSDHISNEVVLKGRLNTDKARLIAELEQSLQNIDPDIYPDPRDVL